MVLMTFADVGACSFPCGFGWLPSSGFQQRRGSMVGSIPFFLGLGRIHSTISLSDSCYIFLTDSPLPRLRHSIGSSLGYRIGRPRIVSGLPSMPINAITTTRFWLPDSNGMPFPVVLLPCLQWQSKPSSKGLGCFKENLGVVTNIQQKSCFQNYHLYGLPPPP